MSMISEQVNAFDAPLLEVSNVLVNGSRSLLKFLGLVTYIFDALEVDKIVFYCVGIKTRNGSAYSGESTLTQY